MQTGVHTHCYLLFVPLVKPSEFFSFCDGTSHMTDKQPAATSRSLLISTGTATVFRSAHSLGLLYLVDYFFGTSQERYLDDRNDILLFSDTIYLLNVIGIFTHDIIAPYIPNSCITGKGSPFFHTIRKVRYKQLQLHWIIELLCYNGV